MNIDTQLTAKQSQDIDLVKALAIIMVLFIHANILDCLPDVSEKSTLGIFNQIVTRILVDNAVPIFFIISGYLFFYKRGTYREKWKKRFKSLVVPYVFWCLVGFLIPFILQCVLGLESLFTGNELKKIADFESLDYLRMFWDLRDGAPILSTMWFLRDLIILIAMTPIIELFSRRLKYAFPIILTIVYLFLPFGLPGISSTSLWWFGIGCWFALEGGNLFSILDKLKIGYVGVVWGFAFVFAVFSYRYEFGYECVHSLFMIIHFVGIYKLTTIVPMRVGKSLRLLMKIGAASFFIYAFHEPWMGYIMKLMFKMFNPTGLSLYIAPFFFVSLALSYSYAVFVILHRIAPGFLNLITGSRIDIKK